MFSTANFWSQLFVLLGEVKQKSFQESLAHHVVVLSLSNVGWIGNFQRFASILFFLHDISEVSFYEARILKCLKFDKLSMIIYKKRHALFIAARLVLLPRCIHIFITQFPFRNFPLFYAVALLSVSLTLLHVFAARSIDWRMKKLKNNEKCEGKACGFDVDLFKR